MELVRSEAPEVVRCAASAQARAILHVPALGVLLVYGFFPDAFILLIAVSVALVASAREAAWVGVPAFLAWNGYLLWCTRSPCRNWIVAGCADRVYLRLFARRGWARGSGDRLDAAVFEASEISSMSNRTVEVVLHGSKAQIVEWLVIQPAEAVAESVTERARQLLEPVDSTRSVYVAIQDGRFVIEWKWHRPALRIFFQQLARECPSVVIGNEERSRLDLNGIWRRTSLSLMSVEHRRMLAEAIRLGFYCDCQRLLSEYYPMPLRETKKYMAELMRDGAEKGWPSVRG